VPQFIVAKPLADLQTLQAVIANRYHVLASYAASLKRLHMKDLVALQSERHRSAGRLFAALALLCLGRG